MAFAKNFAGVLQRSVAAVVLIGCFLQWTTGARAQWLEPPPDSDPFAAADDAVPGLLRRPAGLPVGVDVEILDGLIEGNRVRGLSPPQWEALWLALDVLASRSGPVARYQAQVKLDETVASTIERGDAGVLADLVARLSRWATLSEHPLVDVARDLLRIKVRCAAIALEDVSAQRAAEATLARVEGPADPDRDASVADRFDLGSHADLFAVEARDGFAVVAGRAGTIRVSRDAGTRWESAASGTTSTLLDLTLGADGELWAAGTEGALVRSRDEGQTWERVELPFRRHLLGVASLDGGRILAVGDYGLVLRSEAGGEDWTCIPQYADVVLNGVEAVDGGAFAFGEFGVIDRLDADGFVARRGKLETVAEQPYIFDLWFAPDGTTGVAVGLRGLVLRSEDGGATWSPIPFLQDVDLYGIDGHGEAVAVVGDGGFIAISRDGGRTFERSSTPPSPTPLADVAFANDQRLLAAGMRGLILRSEDGGESFQVVGQES